MAASVAGETDDDDENNDNGNNDDDDDSDDEYYEMTSSHSHLLSPWITMVLVFGLWALPNRVAKVSKTDLLGEQ